MNFFTENYYKKREKYNVWHFSIEGFYDDQLSSVHLSIYHNILIDETNVSFYPFKIDIAPDNEKQDYIYLFKHRLIKNLNIFKSPEQINELTFYSLTEDYLRKFNLSPSEPHVFLFSVLIRSTQLIEKQYKALLHWLRFTFPGVQNEKSNTKVIFLLTFQYCGVQEEDDRMKRFLKKEKLSKEGPISENFIHFGNHGHVTPDDVKTWFSEYATTDHVALTNYLENHFSEDKKMSAVEKALTNYLLNPFSIL